jgi:UDP-3-O-[3-hydroxymyristoyl] glucosamine N-acyltransferase
MGARLELALADILKSLGGDLYGEVPAVITGLAPLEHAKASELSFLANPKYQSQLQSTQAACVIVAPALKDAALARGGCIVTPDPYLYFARLTQLWRQRTGRVAVAGIHATAVVDASAVVDPTAQIGPLCVVEAGAHIGAHTVLKSRVTVGEDCSVGAHCIIHAGVVIGADGFGFAPSSEGWVKIEQLGAVRIGNRVEIGANTCIDRGALRDTVLEDGVKLDNLIQIGHNVHVGKNTAMAGCVGVAGSATIGANCSFGGGAIVLGHLQIVDGVHVSSATTVTRSIRKPGNYTGMFPMDDNASWEKNAAALKQLASLRDRIRALEDKHKKQDSP